jgi:hypothetical protein
MRHLIIGGRACGWWESNASVVSKRSRQSHVLAWPAVTDTNTVRCTHVQYQSLTCNLSNLTSSVLYHDAVQYPLSFQHSPITGITSILIFVNRDEQPQSVVSLRASGVFPLMIRSDTRSPLRLLPRTNYYTVPPPALLLLLCSLRKRRTVTDASMTNYIVRDLVHQETAFVS